MKKSAWSYLSSSFKISFKTYFLDYSKNSFLDYASEVHKPAAMIDSATLTGAMVIALGSGTTGVFCKDQKLWNLIEKSGHETGDRAWRMPHYKHYFGK